LAPGVGDAAAVAAAELAGLAGHVQAAVFVWKIKSKLKRNETMRKLTRNNLKVEFSTLSLAVFVIIQELHGTHSRPNLKLKTLPRFCPDASILNTTQPMVQVPELD
jgi:hypothetical protein